MATLGYTAVTPQWYNGQKDWLQCGFCGKTDWCPKGSKVSAVRIFSRAQRILGRVEIKNASVDVNCCKGCSPSHKLYTVQMGTDAPAAPHRPKMARLEPSGESRHDPLQVPDGGFVFNREFPPNKDEFLQAAESLRIMLPKSFWEEFHAWLTSACAKSKEVEALLRKEWTQCAGSAPGFFKTLSHCGAVRVWRGCEGGKVYDDTRVAYKDMENAIYHRGMYFLYKKLDCCSSPGTVGDLVECLLAVAYYMRRNGGERPEERYGYAMRCVDDLETVMMFVSLNWNLSGGEYLEAVLND